jgi:hypothetical protein
MTLAALLAAATWCSPRRGDVVLDF